MKKMDLSKALRDATHERNNQMRDLLTDESLLPPDLRLGLGMEELCELEIKLYRCESPSAGSRGNATLLADTRELYVSLRASLEELTAAGIQLPNGSIVQFEEYYKRHKEECDNDTPAYNSQGVRLSTVSIEEAVEALKKSRALRDEDVQFEGSTITVLQPTPKRSVFLPEEFHHFKVAIKVRPHTDAELTSSLSAAHNCKRVTVERDEHGKRTLVVHGSKKPKWSSMVNSWNGCPIRFEISKRDPTHD